MQFTKVTWYSKLAAIILFIALPFVGFYLGMEYQERIALNRTEKTVKSRETTDYRVVVETEQIMVKTSYEKGYLRYLGTVQISSPCYTLIDETKVLESFPEQVQISLVLQGPPSDVGLCTQNIKEKTFSGRIKVSEKATVSVFVDDKLIK